MSESIVQSKTPVMSNDRRYVGSKETAAYVIYDISQSFNINKYQDIFITDVVRLV